MKNADTTPDAVSAVVEQQNLQRALKLFPDALTAAAERGLKPLAVPPAGIDPLTAPAAAFDPARFEPDE